MEILIRGSTQMANPTVWVIIIGRVAVIFKVISLMVSEMGMEFGNVKKQTQSILIFIKFQFIIIF